MGPDLVEEAAARIDGRLRVTPVLQVEAGGLVGRPVTLKLELFQHTGSFKPRGIFNRMLSTGVGPEGVVAASGGNAGLAVAYAARELGRPATIFVPATAPAVKVDRLRAYGAAVRLAGGSYAEALAAAEDFAERTGSATVHAYDQPEVVAGQGTLARELEAQLAGVGPAPAGAVAAGAAPAGAAPAGAGAVAAGAVGCERSRARNGPLALTARVQPGVLDTVLVAVGGGGLVAGIAGWFAGRVRVVAVEPAACPTYSAALAAGAPVDVEVGGMAADSLGARRIGERCWAARHWIEGSVLVPEEAIASARQRLWEACRVIAEPGGATALAALVAGVYVPHPDEKVAVIVCGANTDPAGVLGLS